MAMTIQSVRVRTIRVVTPHALGGPESNPRRHSEVNLLAQTEHRWLFTVFFAGCELLQFNLIAAFFDQVKLVGGKIVKLLLLTARPLNFQSVDMGSFRKAEMSAQITLRKIAAAARDFANLR